MVRIVQTYQFLLLHIHNVYSTAPQLLPLSHAFFLSRLIAAVTMILFNRLVGLFFRDGNTEDFIQTQYDCYGICLFTSHDFHDLQRRRTIFIFEEDVGKPLSRHYGYEEAETGMFGQFEP